MLTLLAVGVTIASGFALISPVAAMEYGNYCGRGYYNSYGRAPADGVDRICQIHDICTAKGLTDCECNIQLETTVTRNIHGNYTARKELFGAMDSWIFEYYSDRNFCFRRHNFRYDLDFYIPAGSPGFNYLPFYPNQSMYDYEGTGCLVKGYWTKVRKGKLSLLRLTQSQYDQFARNTGSAPPGEHYRSGDTFFFDIKPRVYTVLYNNGKEHLLVTMLKWDGDSYREMFDPLCKKDAHVREPKPPDREI